MGISLLAEIAWCLGAMVLVPLPALADSDQIIFSGSIVEPTCSIEAEQSTTVTGVTPTITGEARRTCARSVNTTAASQIYVLTVMHLSSSMPDRVLKYFDDYVKASRTDGADPALLTQTYE